MDQQTSERKIDLKLKVYTTSRDDVQPLEDIVDTYMDYLFSDGTSGIKIEHMRLEAVPAELARWKTALGRI